MISTDLVKAILVLPGPADVSLDGYMEDVTGGIAFSEPDEEVHRFANQQTRETTGLLFGRGPYGSWRSSGRRRSGPTVAR